MNNTILFFFLFFIITIFIIALPALWTTVKEIGTIMRTAPALQGPYFNDEESE